MYPLEFDIIQYLIAGDIFMPTNQLRFTGFKDPTGVDIFEGDYLILKISDLSFEQREKRDLNRLADAYDIQYMQAYVTPTGQLRYDIDLILIDSNKRALTTAEYFYLDEEDKTVTLEEFTALYIKDFIKNDIYRETTYKNFQLLKNIVDDKLWFKKPALVQREKQ